MRLLLSLLDEFAALLLIFGSCWMVVGSWRTYVWKEKGVPPLTLLAAGACALFLSLLCHQQHRTSQKGRLDYCISALVKGVGSALEMYAQDHDGQLPENLQQLVPVYLNFIPECPMAGRDTYSASYRKYFTAEGTGFIVACEGSHHEDAGVLGDSAPLYHSTTGIYCPRTEEATR